MAQAVGSLVVFLLILTRGLYFFPLIFKENGKEKGRERKREERNINVSDTH